MLSTLAMRLVVLLACGARALRLGESNGLSLPLIAVVGSANLDTTLKVGATLPKAGETIVASGEPASCCGGKGLNQAVAAAKLGEGAIRVAFHGRVGDDGAGAVLTEALKNYRVEAEGVEKAEGVGSGQGFVLVEDGGTVLSIVSRGANFAWDEKACDEAWADAVVGEAKFVLLQREIPEFVNEAVAAAASRKGICVIQDGGGEDRPVSDAHLARCDYLCPNLTELVICHCGEGVTYLGERAIDKILPRLWARD